MVAAVEKGALPVEKQSYKGDDDGEEDDDDYVPDTEAKDDDDEGDEGMDVDEANALPTCSLSATKRKAVDEAFEELFGYSFGTTFQPKRRRKEEGGDESNQYSLLARIFGAAVASKLVATSHSVKRTDISRAPRPDLSAPTMITETKVFAGKKIEVQRKIQPSAHQTTKAAAAAAATKDAPTTTAAVEAESSQKPKGLDSLLKEISGPSQMSTVAKTSADWDTFKTEAGVEEQLEQQAQSKTAFLVKKDFLQRVDERRFEHERKQRDQERAKRGK